MSELSVILESESNTTPEALFAPVLGRIYASEHFPEILHDEAALQLKERLPENVRDAEVPQYSLLAVAVRSANMDRFIKTFIKHNPDPVIIEFGCGLETTFFRNDDGETIWYEIDVPAVMAYRREYLPENERSLLIEAGTGKEDWFRRIRREHPESPILVVAAGLFYYLEEETVLHLIHELQHCGGMELVFDISNKSGAKAIAKKNGEGKSYFAVDDTADLIKSIGGGALVRKQEKYYAHVEKKGLERGTARNMKMSDKFNMLKVIQLKL